MSDNELKKAIIIALVNAPALALRELEKKLSPPDALRVRNIAHALGVGQKKE